MMVIQGIRQDLLSNSGQYQCRVCDLRIKAKSAMCVKYGKWIYSIYVDKCEWNILEAVEHEEKQCEVEIVRVFTYVGDRVSTGGEF